MGTAVDRLDFGENRVAVLAGGDIDVFAVNRVWSGKRRLKLPDPVYGLPERRPPGS
ncbi:MAG: hypothetical protein OXR72_05335 [Gemmatimonadota bacterium]|nr:hypothetical protein [Gemmatimonadota bacterium]